MTESAPAADVLSAILKVLERIEEKLEGQEQRFNAISDISKPIPETRSRSRTSEVDLTELAEIDERPNYQRGSSPQEPVHWRGLEKSEVPYSDLGFSYHEPNYNGAFKKLLETYIGDCWKLPDDKRLPLNFANRCIDWTHSAWNPKLTMTATHQDAIVRGLEQLRRFDKDLRACPGNDFFIIDYDSRSNCRLYRVGDKGVGPELKVSLGEPSHHQWSRLMWVLPPPLSEFAYNILVYTKA